jgi:hypothetical protein
MSLAVAEQQLAAAIRVQQRLQILVTQKEQLLTRLLRGRGMGNRVILSRTQQLQINNETRALAQLRQQLTAAISDVARKQEIVNALRNTSKGGLKRALLVGINYSNTPYQLAGCINDAINMQNQLKTFFPQQPTEYRLLADDRAEKPTKAAIMAGLAWLVAGLRPGDNVLFHFSGHGGRVRDTNGDEVTGLDSCIYPLNGSTLEIITDDELRAALATTVPAGCKCMVILDACHSGSAVDLRYLWESPSQTSISYKEDTKYAKTAGAVLFLSGCRDEQVAADTADRWGRPCGALTMALLDVWKSYGPAIKTKYLLWDVRQYLKANRYSQIPCLSSGMYLDMNKVFDLGSPAI